MKRIILVGMMLLAMVPQVFAKRQMVPCTITYNNGKTVDAFVKANSPGVAFFAASQSKVKLFNADGKKFKVSPKKAKEVLIKFEEGDERLISVQKSASNKRLFLRLELDGDGVRLFNFYKHQNSGGNGQPVVTTIARYLVLQKKGEGYEKLPNGVMFRSSVKSYFSDCPALVQIISEEKYKPETDDVREIVKYYNKNCGRW